MESANQIFCRNVSYLRRKHQLSQQKMADILDVSVSTLRKIESLDNTVRLNCRMLRHLCDAFDISADVCLRTCLESEI